MSRLNKIFSAFSEGYELIINFSNFIKIINILPSCLPIFFFSEIFLYNLNIVRMLTKDLYTLKSFVYLRTGVYWKYQTLLIS